MYCRLRLFVLKNTMFKTKHHFFIELGKILAVVNFRFLVNLDSLLYHLLFGRSAGGGRTKLSNRFFSNRLPLPWVN